MDWPRRLGTPWSAARFVVLFGYKIAVSLNHPPHFFAWSILFGPSSSHKGLLAILSQGVYIFHRIFRIKYC